MSYKVGIEMKGMDEACQVGFSGAVEATVSILQCSRRVEREIAEILGRILLMATKPIVVKLEHTEWTAHCAKSVDVRIDWTRPILELDA